MLRKTETGMLEIVKEAPLLTLHSDFELTSELNGVRLWEGEAACLVEWTEMGHDHCQLFVANWAAAEACFLNHVQEVDAR